MTEPTDTEREQFEEMMRRETFDDLSRVNDGSYKSYEARVGWIAWQADRRTPAPVGVEPVAWRIRHRSDAGMIGHYPWSFTDRIRGGEQPQYEYEPLYTAEVLAMGRVPLPSIASVEMIDAAMVEMQKIYPPLRRNECRQLIDAALGAAHKFKQGGQHGTE